MDNETKDTLNYGFALIMLTIGMQFCVLAMMIAMVLEFYNTIIISAIGFVFLLCYFGITVYKRRNTKVSPAQKG